MKKRLILIRSCLIGIAEILFLVGAAYFIKTNILVSLIITACFQIPLVIRSFLKDARARAVCRLCSVLLLTAGLISLLACHGRNYYIESMADVDCNSIDTSRYLPFEEQSDVAQLNEEIELYLSEKLPVLNGSASLFPLYSAIVNAVYPETIEELNQQNSPFRYTNTQKAYQELLAGTTDVVFSEMPSEQILQMAWKQGKEIQLIPIGAEAFVFFTNRENPIEDLTQQQLQKIYSGEYRNWAELGGEDVEIAAFQQNEGNGAQERMKRFMGKIPLMDSQQQYQLDSEDGITETTSVYTNHRGAIGFSFLYYTRSMDVDKGTRLLAVDGVYPDNQTVSNGEYPLSDPIYCAVCADQISENTQKLLDWILSAQGQRLVEAAGYAPN